MRNDVKQLYNLTLSIYFKYVVKEVAPEEEGKIPTLGAMVASIVNAYRNHYGNTREAKILKYGL